MEKFYQKYFLETSSRPFCAYKELSTASNGTSYNPGQNLLRPKLKIQ